MVTHRILSRLVFCLRLLRGCKRGTKGAQLNVSNLEPALTSLCRPLEFTAEAEILLKSDIRPLVAFKID